MRTRDMGEKFIVPDSDPNKEKVYSDRSEFLHGTRIKERKSRGFYTGRSEKDTGKKYHYDTNSLSPNEDIEHAHGISFLNQVIPEILERFAQQGIKRKVKILDLGGGVGVFADQIRAKFGDQVMVYTTSVFGVSDKTRKELEERKKVVTGDKNATLHKLDAYKSSIVDFRDFPEFDLVIDTYGEMYYTWNKPNNLDLIETNFEEKFSMIIKKLQNGARLFLGKINEDFFSFLWSLDSQFENNNLKITFNGLTKEQWIEELKKIGLDENVSDRPPEEKKIMDYIIDACDGDMDNLSDQSFASLLKRTFVLRLSVCVEKQ